MATRSPCELKPDKAIPLITVKKNCGENEDQFALNPKAISLIKELSSPLKVFAAIGDARVGKSTALNFIHYTLNNVGTSVSDTKRGEEIFQTGDTMQPVTHGVWIAKPDGYSGMENMLLLDVEGTDLGNDAVTDKLSIFTALTSSTLMLFMKESPSTHILDFLYKIVRLSEVAFGKKKSVYFPRLTAVLRGALEPPEEYKNIREYIIDSLISPKWKDGSDGKREAIGTRFPRENITVFNLPYDTSTPKALKIPERLTGTEYLTSIETVTRNILQLPQKSSLEGVDLDGEALAKLAEDLMLVMNKEELWKDLSPNFYCLFEESLCRKSYDKHIEPFLRLTSKEMEDQKEEKMRLFKENCKLTRCIIKAELDIKNAIKQKKNEKQGIISVGMKTFLVSLGGIILAYGIRYVLSDVHLKNKITVLDNSEYETIGLRGVQWVWSEEAERLGLSGKGSGVVAQEVELLYPWAVTEGYDGYKRVNYLALKLLIWFKKFAT